MTRDGSDRRAEELARLKLAASTAEEAARWLRKSLARIRNGHPVEFEIEAAEQALQAALEGINRRPTPRTSEQGGSPEAQKSTEPPQETGPQH